MERSELVEHMGPHPATRLGLDLASPEGRDAWLLAAALLATRAPEARALDAVAGLAAKGLLAPGALAAAATDLLPVLSSGPWKEPDRLAATLTRLARALVERGGVDAVAAEADGFESLGQGLAGLAPGVGPAAVLRFLRPLRRVWPDAADLPPAPVALRAAACLGWIEAGGETLDLGPEDGAAEADCESALERLGPACRRGGKACPLGSACPRRD